MTTKQRAPYTSSSSRHHHHRHRHSDHERTTSSSSDAEAPRKHKKRSSEYSRSHDTNKSSEVVVPQEVVNDNGSSNSAWESFTSPDGRTYYYNKVTQESRWKLPKELRNATTANGTSKSQEPATNTDTHGDRASKPKNLQQVVESERASETRHVIGSRTPASTLVSNTAAATSASSSSKKNALVQRLQASLAGRINPMANMGPPPMIHIPRGDSHSDSVASSFPGQNISDTNGSGINENGGNATSEEQQYDAETAHMTAAERLRFLRKKRQEMMFAKEKIVEEDDFMKEFERNMTKKHDGSFDWRKKREDEHAKEREAREKERERAKEKKAQEEAERKSQQAREEEKAQKAREREEEEREREAENERRRQKEEQEKEQEKAAREEELALKKEKKSVEKKNKKVKEVDEDAEEKGREAAAEVDEPRVRSSSHAKQKEKTSKHKKEDGDDTNAVVVDAETEVVSSDAQEETEETHESKDEAHTKEESEAGQHPKPEHDKPRRHSEHHEKLTEHAHGADNGDEHNADGDDEAVAELERRRLKQEKRERRRLAKLEAAVVAQSLDSLSPVKKSKKNRKQSGHEENVGAGYTTEPQHHQHHEHQQQHPLYPNEMYQQYLPSPYGYPPPGSGSMPPHSTGGSCTCCRPHPFVPVHVPPQMPSYPMYYPYAQPPPPPPVMMMMIPPHPVLPQAPPHPQSQPGMALVPFAQGQLAAYGGAPTGYGGVRPTLDRCEGCKGAGVGLVEKNGFCKHCNRLRLDFIVASARMRQRCSVCGGWGLGLVQASTGKCDHCSRGAQQQQQQSRGSVSRRQSSVETQQRLPPGAVAMSLASEEMLKRSGSVKKVTIEDKKTESIEWDQSSDDGSEWDD